MKKFLLCLPLAALLAGCPANNENATSDNAAPPPVIPDTPIDNGAKAVESGSGADNTVAPDAEMRDYRVVPERAASPAAADALKKMQVPPPPKSMQAPATARVRLQTTQGPITVELNGKAAPLHVKSFLYLSKRGFYNGTQFHRYEPDFVIQGGDPLSKNPETRALSGSGGPGYQVPREHNELAHEAMVIAAARTNDPDSAGSQFYFTLKPAPNLDQGDGYTVFGKVVEGEANVLKLRKGDTLKSVTVLEGPVKK